MFILKFVLLFYYFGNISSVKFKMGTECLNSHQSDCVEINRCSFFADLFRHIKKPYPRHVIGIMQNYYCGIVGNSPKVCCPKSGHSKETTPVTFSPLISIKNHKHYNLLPHSDCGQIKNGLRITGGSRSSIMEFPWVTLLLYATKRGSDYFCSGSLINERYVLTAAHCVDKVIPFGIRLGEYNINSAVDCDEFSSICAPPVQDSYIEDIIIHPDYVPGAFVNDLALIRLAIPANTTAQNVKPICLPTQEFHQSIEGRFAVIPGWGVTETGYKSFVLLKSLIPIVPIEQCNKIYRKYFPINGKQICAGGVLGRDICDGDTGGPLKLVESVNGKSAFVQYGVASFGNRKCGEKGFPAVYTNVALYMDWILDNLNP